MPSMKVLIFVDGEKQEAVLDYEVDSPSIKLLLQSGKTFNVSGLDVYECLGKLLVLLPEVNFLCKGAKLNVRPSSMSSQMTSGMMAYEHLLGVRATRKSLVNIFDYDDVNIVNDPKLQDDFFFKWLRSLEA
ncbi:MULTISPECIES: hypothetical protein [unclassified Pseudomonas]|uniref:hypothetical protein n=1 Tax=unclassified Pseudomonas TaxID=196821 RepID=UPI000B8272E6|nr:MULTISPECIES: hypothetical protein [unclassified Pseudomonas]